MDKHNRAVRRIQNLAILLLTLSALFLVGNLPLFGELSDRSLIELAYTRLNDERIPETNRSQPLQELAAPIRIVFSNSFTRYGADSLTTLSSEFEAVGFPLREAIGSANTMSRVNERILLEKLRGEGLYFDFITELPLDLLGQILGVAAPDTGLTAVRRMFLCPAEGDEAILYMQDRQLGWCRFLTAVHSSALKDYLASLSGNGAALACVLDSEYASLSPYTFVPGETVSYPVAECSETVSESVLTSFLRRAEFNAHTDNRFVESSGTVIVREASNTIHLYPDGTITYQGERAGEGSLFFVPSASPDKPTMPEAVSAACHLASALLQEPAGDAVLYLSGVSRGAGTYTATFDYMLNGTPICFSDGTHAAVVTVAGDSITSFTMKLRQYTLTDTPALLLPVRQAAGIVRQQREADLTVVYYDNGGATVAPAWIQS